MSRRVMFVPALVGVLMAFAVLGFLRCLEWAQQRRRLGA